MLAYFIILIRNLPSHYNSACVKVNPSLAQMYTGCLDALQNLSSIFKNPDQNVIANSKVRYRYYSERTKSTTNKIK